MLFVEFLVALHIQIALHVANRKDEPDLWTDSDHAGFEISKSIPAAAIAGKLLVEITDGAYVNLFRQELRHSPVEVPVDAVRIIRARIPTGMSPVA